MDNKMTPQAKLLNATAMAWWRHWRDNMIHPMSPEMLAYYNDPATRALVEACADLHAATLGEQLDRDTSTGTVEQ